MIKRENPKLQFKIIQLTIKNLISKEEKLITLFREAKIIINKLFL